MYPVVILCGGKAKRLGAVAQDTPKALLDINGTPFLKILIDNFAKQGVRRFYFCLGHHSEQIEAFLMSIRSKKLDFHISYDDELFSGTGGAVKKLIQKISTPFFVTYGDSYLDINLGDLVTNYIEDEGPLMTIFKNSGLYDKSNCTLKDGRLIYSKRNPQDDADFIDYGLGIYASENFSNFPNSFDLSVLQEKFSREGNLQYYVATKRFYEIGSLEGLDEFKKYVSQL
jgi:NDP-sugar pyrophosphorylase family protein